MDRRKKYKELNRALGTERRIKLEKENAKLRESMPVMMAAIKEVLGEMKRILDAAHVKQDSSPVSGGEAVSSTKGE